LPPNNKADKRGTDGRSSRSGLFYFTAAVSETTGCILTIRFGPEKGFVPYAKAAIREEESMVQAFKRFLADESGATAIEYGLICAGIAVAIIAIIKGLGDKLIAALTTLLNAFP
jgi:pilus assembly protein Flp/PilA